MHCPNTEPHFTQYDALRVKIFPSGYPAWGAISPSGKCGQLSTKVVLLPDFIAQVEKGLRFESRGLINKVGTTPCKNYKRVF
jgi:hypothetical protein